VRRVFRLSGGGISVGHDHAGDVVDHVADGVVVLLGRIDDAAGDGLGRQAGQGARS
jgi:hypothetical protein